MRITVYQDIICPWCYVGKKFLQKAINQFDGDVSIDYRSYFLNPEIPETGIENANTYLIEKYGREQTKLMNQRLMEMGKNVGINFKFSPERNIPNTKLAHQLLKIFPDHKETLLDKLYHEYFENERDIGSIMVLVEIVDELDLPKKDTKKLLETNEYLNNVMADYDRAIQIGARGVPFFVFNDEQALYGAHQPETILQTLNRIKSRQDVLELM